MYRRLFWPRSPPAPLPQHHHKSAMIHLHKRARCHPFRFLLLLLLRNLEELGLGPFLCPTAVSSGMHGVLMASALCGQVDLFGYSYSYSQLKTRPGHNSGCGIPRSLGA